MWHFDTQFCYTTRTMKRGELLEVYQTMMSVCWDFRKWINLRMLQSSRRRIKMYRHQIPTNSLSAKVHSTLELTNNDYMAITNSDIFLIPSSNHSAREDPRKIIHTPHKTSLRRHQLHQSKFIYKLMLVASERMKQVTKSLPTIMVILRTHFES